MKRLNLHGLWLAFLCLAPVAHALADPSLVAPDYCEVGPNPSRAILKEAIGWAPHAVTNGISRLSATYRKVDGRNTVIAIIDQGIDWTHPAIGREKIVGAWHARKKLATPEDLLPHRETGNHHGSATAWTMVASPYTCWDARQNQRFFYRGIAPRAKIYGFRIEDTENLDDLSLQIRSALEAIVKLRATMNIVAVNLVDPRPAAQVGGGKIKWNMQKFGAYQAALQKVRAAGIFVATPVANFADPQACLNSKYRYKEECTAHEFESLYPPLDTFIQPVTGTDSGVYLMPFVQKFPTDVLMAAPSIRMPIYYGPKRGPFMNERVGTSWATAQVTAAAALLQQTAIGAGYRLSPAQISCVLKTTGLALKNSSIRGIQLDKAVNLVLTPKSLRRACAP